MPRSTSPEGWAVQLSADCSSAPATGEGGLTSIAVWASLVLSNWNSQLHVYSARTKWAIWTRLPYNNIKNVYMRGERGCNRLDITSGKTGQHWNNCRYRMMAAQRSQDKYQASQCVCACVCVCVCVRACACIYWQLPSYCSNSVYCTSGGNN